MSEVTGDFRRILNDAEKAYTQRNFDALEVASKQVPTGYTLVILNSMEHGPCFCIAPTEHLGDFTGRFRCIDPDKLATSSVPVEGQETSSEPDGPSSTTGIRGELEPRKEDGRGNL